MASANQTSSEYVNHHLLHLSNAGDMPVGLFAPSIMNFDTLFWSLAMGLLTIFLFWLAARKATSGVPGRFQVRHRDVSGNGGRSVEKYSPWR